jgi:hypothetical protein
MYYEVELVDNISGCVIEHLKIEEVIITEDWDI